MILAALLALACAAAGRTETFWPNGAAATVHPLATEAAIEAARRGGNAVDAAAAAALTLGVVDGHNSGIGGGCFLLLRTARGAVLALDGRETAPAAAARDMFLRNGQADPELSQTGALAAGVPGSLAVYEYVLRHFGKLKLKDLLLPAARLAEQGFAIDASYARRLRETAGDLAKFAEAKRIFFRADGSPLSAGEWLRQPELAASYRAIAEHGIEWFYKNDFAKKTEAWMRQNGGLLTAKDFREHRMQLREPVKTRYRGYEILGFPPPSSGGAHVAQILRILENFELRSHPAYSADSIHLLAESMRFAFADRAYWLGDPDFVKVPQGIVSQKYAESVAAKIRLDRAAEIPAHGPADQFGTAFFGKHTTHFSAADAEGNWVACTATLNTSFGSKVVIPGTGILLNNQMDDFSAQPGKPNFFGLVGAEANAVAPRKRPLSSMSPTIVLKSGQPILSLGAAGGPTIISQTVVNLANILEYGMGLEEALAAPRVHHQWKPDELVIEQIPDVLREKLEKKGHKVRISPAMGAAQIVQRTEAGFTAASDPRVAGKAAGW